MGVMYIEQIKESCISYRGENIIVVEPCDNKEAFESLANPKRLTFFVDKNGLLKKQKEENLKGLSWEEYKKKLTKGS